MKKGEKAQGNLLVTVLIIIIILVAIIILWNIIRMLLVSNIEVTNTRAELVRMQISVDKFHQDFGADHVNLTLERSALGRILVNETKEDYTLVLDVVSVADLSTSMGNNYPGECKMNTTSSCCASRNNCNNTADCQACNPGATFSNNICYMNSTCSRNSSICLGTTCKGIWRNKLAISKQANSMFMNSLLQNAGNKFGLVAYDTNVIAGSSHSISNLSSSLNTTITNWAIGSGTCICCGINYATNMFSTQSSSSLKVMVVMSDGETNRNCSGGGLNNAANDAITASQNAKNNGIIVHSIFLGSGALATGEATLQSIANVGGGGYYPVSEVSDLSQTYTTIATRIIREYQLANRGDYLKILFFNGTTSYAYNLYNIPLPSEKITFRIPQESGEDIRKNIINITKIEVYAISHTSSGKEVSSKITDWKVEI